MDSQPAGKKRKSDASAASPDSAVAATSAAGPEPETAAEAAASSLKHHQLTAEIRDILALPTEKICAAIGALTEARGVDELDAWRNDDKHHHALIHKLVTVCQLCLLVN